MFTVGKLGISGITKKGSLLGSGGGGGGGLGDLGGKAGIGVPFGVVFRFTP